MQVDEVLRAEHVFLEGPAGSGKTHAAISRIQHLIDQGVNADEILLLVPQRSYTIPYEEALDASTWYRLGKATVGGIAQRTVALFWPLVLETSRYPFEEDKEPTFLTYEVAQFIMAKLVAPLLQQGYFAELRLIRNRLYSQLLDNLNKATVNQIPLEDVEEYLRSDSGTDATRKLLFNDIANTILAYREYTVQHNLLDFSLYNDVFWELFTQEPEVQAYMSRQFKHLVYENAEEDFPLAHSVVRSWISRLESSLIISDSDGGYRKFLAANPGSANDLRTASNTYIRMDENTHTPQHVMQVGTALVEAIGMKTFTKESLEGSDDPGFFVYSDRLHYQMIERAVQRVIDLVEDGVPPKDIAIISPFLNDSLHYSITTRLDKGGVAYHAHKPSRTLKDNPITKVLMTLTALAHPHWGLTRPTLEAVTHMLDLIIEPLDLIRSTLLGASVYEESSEGIGLRSFETVAPDLRDRITFGAGEHYDRLRLWLEAYKEAEQLPIDHFLSRIFGELLSQKGFGLYQDNDGGVQVAMVVESARKFRQAIERVQRKDGEPVGKAYVEMVQEGVVSAFYNIEWTHEEDAVLMTPVHTFLLRNRVYPYQVWLDVSSPSWHKRIPQPLTNPYILSKDWQIGRQWSASVERYFEVERLERIVLGLVRRCSSRIFAYFCELSVSGQEQTGNLLAALSRTKRQYVDTSFRFNEEDV